MILSGQTSVAGFVAYHELINSPLPCFGSACAILSHDPLVSWLPLGIVGTGYALSLAALVLWGLYRRQPNALRFAQHLSFVGSLVAILLTMRAMYVAGELCPWCTAHTILCVLGSVILTLANLEVSPPRSRSLVSVLCCAVVFWGGGLAYANRLMQQPHGNELALRSLSRSDLLADSVPLSSLAESPDSGVKFILFVDLSCPSCLQFIRQCRETPGKNLIRLRFVRPHTGFSGAAAQLLQSNVHLRDYPKLLTAALEQTEATEQIEKVARTAGGVGLGVGKPLATQAASKLHIVATPTAVRLDGERAAFYPIGLVLEEARQASS